MTCPRLADARRIHELIGPWASESPGRAALRDAQVALDYGQLAEAAAVGARQLERLGVRPGDRVVIVGENCVAVALLVLACSRIDAWFCVLNARLSPREIDAIVDHAAARRVFYTSQVSPEALRHAERAGALPSDWPAAGPLHVGPLRADAVAEPCFEAAGEQVAGLIYTSGTSGAPKGVMLTHANLMFAARAVQQVRGIGPADVLYGVLPMAHVVGLSTQLLGALASGASVRIEPRFSASALAEALQSGVTAFTGVPAMYSRLLDWLREEGRPLRAPGLRLIGVAGSPLTPALKAQVEQVFGLPLLNGYGLTESAPTVAQVRSGAPRDDCSVGPPLPGVEVRVAAAAGQAAPNGAVGELWVRGPNVMKGYYRDEGLTREAIDADGWFHTGDMARQDEDGALHIVGRAKELIIRSGFNVYPLEVEQVINGFPGVLQSAVVGRSVEHNEEVVAFVETAAGQPLDEARLRGFLRERLSPYKQPAEIRVLPQLPAAPTGKVLKAVLKQMAQQPAHQPNT